MKMSIEQQIAVETNENKVIVAAGAGAGKSIPDYTKIPMYNGGFKKVSDIQVGDLLIDRNGNPTKVLNIFPQGEKEIVKINFNDGRIAECCEEHLWNIFYESHRGKSMETISTKKMIEIADKKGYAKPKKGFNLKIPVNQPVKYFEKDLRIDPYVLGLFIGDGSFRESSLHFYTDDFELIKNIEEITGWENSRYVDDKHKYRYQFKNPNCCNNISTKDFLKNYPNLINVIGYEKSIPEDFKFSSIEQRYSIIQGLMDSDGYADDKGRCSFTSTSISLIKDVQLILRSLGFITTIEEDKRDKYTLGICYNLNIQGTLENKINLFRLTRKKERVQKHLSSKGEFYLKDSISITKIERTGVYTPMTCFLVDNSEHLFLMNDFIVTHNTRVIIERIKYLIEKGINPKNIYAITFTNMAAQEMLERIGPSGEGIFIGTIHSLANRILITNGIDTSDSIQGENFDNLFTMIEERLRDERFEGELLTMPEVEHLLVDEFQDICDNEFSFMTQMINPTNFYAVGDSRQAIYGFKGSNYKFFMDMIEDPFTSLFELNDNYRCGVNIIDYANQALKGVTSIYKTRTRCQRDYAGMVEEEDFSYDTLCNEIKSIGEFKDWFVLCRTNQEVEDTLFVLKKQGIPTATFKKSEKTYEELQEELNGNTVKVLTIHSAKGLEANNVAVIGSKNWNDEEKRISYVAFTRAKDYLLVFRNPRRTNKKKKSVYDEYMPMMEW